MSGRIIGGCMVLLACGFVMTASAKGAPPLRATAFSTVVIEPSKVSGVLWLERDVIEAKQPIDRDGDMQYTPGELIAARGPMTDYVNGSFLLLWGGKIHPIVARDVTTEKRPGLKYDYLKITWVSRDSPNGAAISIVSRLLREVWHEARTMISVTFGRQKEVWVLSPTDYFESSLMGMGDENRTGLGPSKTAQRRFACGNMCLGVELKDRTMKCPKCGHFLAEARGAPIPGAGYFGRHNGPLMSLGMGGRKLEAVLASRQELRVYLTNEILEKFPADKMSGSVEMYTDEMMETTLVKDDFKIAPGGSCLTAKVPANLNLPIRVRCNLNIGDGAGSYLVDFFLPDVEDVKD